MRFIIVTELYMPQYGILHHRVSYWKKVSGMFTQGFGESGFTLIELLVVIAIIGLLASVVVVSSQNARREARTTRRKADIVQISKALELYYADNQSYPIGLFASEPGDPIAYNGADWIPGLAPKYIAKLPTDPLGGDSALCGGPNKNAYVYRGGRWPGLQGYDALHHGVAKSTRPIY